MTIYGVQWSSIFFELRQPRIVTVLFIRKLPTPPREVDQPDWQHAYCHCHKHGHRDKARGSAREKTRKDRAVRRGEKRDDNSMNATQHQEGRPQLFLSDGSLYSDATAARDATIIIIIITGILCHQAKKKKIAGACRGRVPWTGRATRATPSPHPPTTGHPQHACSDPETKVQQGKGMRGIPARWERWQARPRRLCAAST